MVGQSTMERESTKQRNGMAMKGFVRSLGVCSLVVLLLGCGVADRVGNRFGDTWAGELVGNEDRVRVTILADDSLNPDIDGEPLSVVLRIYQLTEIGTFAISSPHNLWTDADQVLGKALVSQREVTLLPGEFKIDVAALDPGAQFVGVAAFFRNSFRDDWKVVFDADELRRDGLLGASEGVHLYLVDDQLKVGRGDTFLAVE